MLNNITVLDFDQTYEKQSFLKDQHVHRINLQAVPSTNLFCERGTLRNIARKIGDTNKVTFIGNGNYHYISYILLSKIQQPFTLVLFDHHTDTLKSPSEDLISCGSWVLESLERLPNLMKVLIIGISEEGEKYIPPSIDGKVMLYTKHFLRLNFNKALHSILKEISTDLVYISIDKDVLDRKEAITAWDHGNMRLRQLLIIVKEIMKYRKISGIDICGEYPVSPMTEFERETVTAIKKNSYANEFLVKHILNWLNKKDDHPEILQA